VVCFITKFILALLFGHPVYMVKGIPELMAACLFTIPIKSKKETVVDSEVTC
jgi:hypothetical protein